MSAGYAEPSAPSLDQLMEDLRKIARQAPDPDGEAEPAHVPRVQSLSLVDHGIKVQGVEAGGEARNTDKGFFTGKTIALLGGALLVVVVGGALVLTRRKSAGERAGAGRGDSATPAPSAAFPRAAAYRNRAGDEEGAAAEFEDAAEDFEDAERRRVHFAEQIEVREFKREEPARVNVKISSDDVLE